jgi:hypothetical protein
MRQVLLVALGAVLRATNATPSQTAAYDTVLTISAEASGYASVPVAMDRIYINDGAIVFTSAPVRAGEAVERQGTGRVRSRIRKRETFPRRTMWGGPRLTVSAAAGAGRDLNL